MKNRRWLALILAAALAVTALSITAFAAADTGNGSEKAAAESAEKPAHGGKGGREKTAEPEGAVGKETAKAAALADAGLTAEKAGKVRSRVTKAEDGTVIYKVSFTVDGQKYSYKVDALTGKILEKSVNDASESGAHEKKSA